MKLKLSMIAVVLSVVTGAAWADEEKKGAMKPYRGSAEFERIKKLAGKWRGKMNNMKMELEYTVVAAGSAVIERAFPGTEMEMVTMYHDNKDGKLAMTHFCMLKNRPHLVLESSDDKSITMDATRTADVATMTPRRNRRTLRTQQDAIHQVLAKDPQFRPLSQGLVCIAKRKREGPRINSWTQLFREQHVIRRTDYPTTTDSNSRFDRSLGHDLHGCKTPSA